MRQVASGKSTVAAAGIVAILLLATDPPLQSQTRPANFPARLEDFLAKVIHPTPQERANLLAGQPVTKLMDGDPSTEVAVFGAVWVNAPVHRYVEAIQDIDKFESGKGFRITKRISAPPKLEDFSAMRITPEDMEDIRNCRVGDCDVKLSEQALRRFQTGVDWKSQNPQESANGVMRKIALEYVQGYLQGGDQQLAVYRDGSRPTLVAQEFRSMVDQMPAMAEFMPDLRRYLLEFPNVQLPNASSFLYWQDVQFGLKPTLRISHLTIREGPSETVVASKMLYASHYFWTALELRTLVPDPSRGPGFWLFTTSRSRSDGLSGFLGRLIRGRVRSEAVGGTLVALQATKRKLEK